MKPIYNLSLWLFSLTTFGQTCDTVAGKFINCVDAAGFRQGYWELQKKHVLFSGYSGFGSEQGCHYFEEAKYFPLAQGHYSDNKKVGTWDHYSGDRLVSLDRRITYFQNGSVKDEHLVDRYTLEINQDTSSVSGMFYHRLDSIKIECQEEKCSYTLSTGQKLTTFSFAKFDTLEYELLRLKLNVYDEEIRTHCNNIFKQ